MSTATPNTSSKLLRVLLHLGLWLLFIQILFDLGGLYYSFEELVRLDASQIDEAFLIIPLLVLLFYGNGLWLAPFFLNKGKWWKYIVSLIAVFALMVFLGDRLYVGLASTGKHFRIDRLEFLDGMLLIYPIVLMASLSWSVTKIALHNSEKERLARKNQQKAELQVLTAQFNPHFLYNTLNSIYALSSEENAPKTTEAVLKLSEIMRYPINRGNERSVLLSEEVQFLEGYIDLQRIRLGNNYPIQFTKFGDLSSAEIMPLCLMPMLENAFKYGVSQHHKTAIEMNLSVEGYLVEFRVHNQVIQDKQVASFKAGIENLRSRLELVFPEMYQLELQQEKNAYQAILKIDTSA